MSCETQTKNVQKLAALTLIALALAALVACDGDTSPNSGSSTDTTTKDHCELPANNNWVASSALAANQFHDTPGQLTYPSIVKYQDRYHAFAVASNATNLFHSTVYFNFSNWTQAIIASQNKLIETPAGTSFGPQSF